jgi:uncharacterized protein YecE (DUF72 family)
LLKYISSLPKDLPLAVEFRHPQWFEPDALDRMAEVFMERKVGLIISDTAGRRDALHMRLTAPFCIVRFGGNNLHPSDEIRMRDWANKVNAWKRKGLESFEFWMHQPDSNLTPEACTLFASLWKELSGEKFSLPWYDDAQGRLFE